MLKKIVSLAIFLIFVVGGGSAIGISNMPGQWYADLAKPSFNPPNWIFGPVWSILYVMIAIAGWMLWQRHRQSAAMKAWFAAVAVNFLWSPSFFGLQNVGLALIVVTGMLISIVVFIYHARKLNPTIAWLFVPYGFWVAFAAFLNATIFAMN